MALVPPEILSDIYKKPEIRIEGEISELLERNNLPDDVKVKLLNILLSRYQRLIHKPKEPIKVSIAKDETKEIPPPSPPPPPSSDNSIINQIKITIPQSYQKFISPLVSLLKQSEYNWNNKGELVVNNQVIEGSNIVDLISYLMRSRKSVLSPVGFNIFWEGIRKLNIPREWIGNKSIQATLDIKDSSQYRPRIVESPEEIFSTFSPRVFYRWKAESQGKKRKKENWTEY